MLVYILNKEELTSFTLPSIISGSYWIKDSNEKNLINISEEMVSGKLIVIKM